MKRLLLIFLSAILISPLLPAQNSEEPADSLVSLLSAKSMQFIEEDGVSYRKVVGPARFFHNNTYLICDTALWNVNTEIIDAVGNVRILQEETVLTGDSLRYFVNLDLAQFRGHLVQLEDKDHNLLRTNNLDYNTKDSVAVFRNGGALKDKDGQIIESINGTYDSKAKLFTFADNVNMFTDSIFVKTTRLEYRTDLALATFGRATDVWKDESMLSSDAGWYDRNREVFFFSRNVHAMSEDKEGWADSLYFHRYTSDMELYGNVQLTDSLRKVTALAGSLLYVDSLSRIRLARDPAVVGVADTTGTARDSVWFAADTMVYRTVPKYAVDSVEISNAAARLKSIEQDAVTAYRKNAAEEARKAAEDAKKNDPDAPPEMSRGDNAPAASVTGKGAEKKAAPSKDKKPRGRKAAQDDAPKPAPAVDASAVSDSLAAPAVQPADSLAAPAVADTLVSLAGPSSGGSMMASVSARTAADSVQAVPADSVAVPADSVTAPLDSTKIGFLVAIGKARLYRQDVQILSDSLRYSDLDSLVRLFKRPLVWNEGNRQFSSDSLYAVIRNGAMEKAHLMSDAFIIIQEDVNCFDQIRGTEMIAHFDENNALRRFDALGDATALFYIKEDSVLATVNKSQSKMMHANFKDGEIEEVYYFQEPKSDAIPLAQMKDEDRIIKGFEWQPEKQPKGPEDITTRSIRPSERIRYDSRPRATYVQTDIYFPGYMDGIYKQIADNERARRERGRDAESDTRKTASVDSTAHTAADSLHTVPVKDSLAVKERPSMSGDSLSVATDSLEFKVLTKAEIRAKKRAEKAAEREARWAEKDKKDADKLAAKEEKQAEKLRRKKLKAILEQKAQDKKDADRLERYRLKYEKRKAARARRDASKKVSVKSKDSAKESQTSS